MSYQEPVQMHQRYKEFLAFMADCPHRKTPETMQTAFWAWLDVVDVAESFQKSSTAKQEEINVLKTDLDRLHRERDSFQQQARVLAEEVERLNNLFLVGFNQAVGERGHACMAIDGSNL